MIALDEGRLRAINRDRFHFGGLTSGIGADGLFERFGYRFLFNDGNQRRVQLVTCTGLEGLFRWGSAE